ncbi:MAG: hypothetical protein PHF06_00925 [Sphaerochaeta sp.]|jgi:hypothetical protein|uniref:Uncharacterized protein n=2 Tax=root TaxID=1 RepID=A0ABY4DAB4_9SPIR|nr:MULTISPECIES: hypothetical protein [Sphaerochaeta]MDT3358251.1 hypothetical protein [Spirochaetota bacterium]MDD2394372.1 hypothetical protein [Sphaerochaeta sp.]MDD3424988.1 hypothetical protein [Sphaerochaeta sp.]MDD4036921.1 hypothetical protein [Sphaerochaeta sp.]MDD4449891.1 hypothetical protein [Sphaerochaeta sp.]
MKTHVLLPYLFALLLTATPLAYVLLLPSLLFLTDATYMENVYEPQRLRLSVSMLANGYRLRTIGVKADVDEQTLQAILGEENGYVICSPVITQALQGFDSVDYEGVWVGMGKSASPVFGRMIATHADEGIWQKIVDKRKSEILYIRDNESQYRPRGVPPDLVLTKGESESDGQFTQRIRKALLVNPVIHLYVPSMGEWALPLLGQASLLWTVEGSYKHVIPPSHLYGVVVEDLVRTFKQVTETAATNILADKRLLTAREMHGSWL